MFGGAPEGLFGAQVAPMNTGVGGSSAAAAENGSSLAGTFSASTPDPFAAPPPPSSSAGAAESPASRFDAPPRGAFEAPPPPPSSGAAGGSPPAGKFSPSRGASGGTLELGAAGSRVASKGIFGFPADGRTGPFGDAHAIAGGPGERPSLGSVAPFGSPPRGEGTFGGDGEGGDQSSNWWESETSTNDLPNAQMARSETLASSAAALGENLGDSTDAVDALDGMQEERPTTHEPQNETPRPAFPETAGDELEVPPADMFGPPGGAHVAKAEMKARDQEVPPLRQSPRPQGIPKGPGPSRVVDSNSFAPAPFSSQPRYGTKEDVGDVEGKDSTEAGVQAGSSGCGGEGGADRTASPGWEKQPSPPLELGVFGAPPDDSFEAAEPGAGLFRAAVDATTATTAASTAAADKSAEGNGEHDRCGAPSAKSDGGPESDRANGSADDMVDTAAAPAPAVLTSHDLVPKIVIPSNLHPRSSFVANDGTSHASAVAMAVGIAPSSPPRLFASRSSSWAKKDHSPTQENSDYQGMFADTERDPSSGLPSKKGSAQQLKYTDESKAGKITARMSTSSVSKGEVPALLLPKANLARPSASLNPPPAGSNASGKPPKYSQGAQPPFCAIPEVLGSQSPPRLCDRPYEQEGSPTRLAPSSSSSNAREGESDGPIMATLEGGGRALPGSTLSTPFGACSRGPGTTPEIAEGFQPLEDGRPSDDRPTEMPLSIGKQDDATDAAEFSKLSESSRKPPASAIPPNMSAEGGSINTDAAIGTTNSGEGEGITSNLRVGERKEDEQPRSAAADADATPQASADPFPFSAAGEATRKVDADSAPDGEDGWSDDDWGVEGDDDAEARVDDKADDVGDDKEGVKEEPAGGAAAVEVGDGGVDAVEGGHDGRDGREGDPNLVGSEGSGGDESSGRGSGEDRSRGVEEDDGKGSRSESESASASASELDSFDDKYHSNDVSIAETTASDFFAVSEQRDLILVCQVRCTVICIICTSNNVNHKRPFAVELPPLAIREKVWRVTQPRSVT